MIERIARFAQPVGFVAWMACQTAIAQVGAAGTPATSFASVAYERCAPVNAQSPVDMPELDASSIKQVLQAFPEANAKDLPDGLVTDVCRFQQLLVGTKVTGFFSGYFETHIFLPDGRFLKYLASPFGIATGRYFLNVAAYPPDGGAQVPVVRVDAGGSFQFRAQIAARVKNGKIELFRTYNGAEVLRQQ